MKEVLGIAKPVIAMLHVPSSPGVPGFPGVDDAVATVMRDLESCLTGEVDALLIENMHDFPCVPEEEMGPEIAAYLTRVATAVRRQAGDEIPIGIQVLFAANCTALAVALASGLDFIRAEGWLYAHVSDKGPLGAQGGKVKRYQQGIGAENIRVFTDIRKKHASHAWTADLAPADWARLLALHRSDGAIVTGTVTGVPPDAADLQAVRAATDLPLFIGSGLTCENLPDYFPLADAFIVGSHFKQDGNWERPVDVARVRELMAAARRLRTGGSP